MVSGTRQEWNDISIASPGHGALPIVAETSWMFLSDQTALSNLLRRLQITRKHLARDPLWQELWTLSRLIYRNNNQHRRAVFFQRIVQVKKQLARLHALNLPDALCALAALFPSVKDVEQWRSWRDARFPARTEAVFVLQRLCAAARLATQTAELAGDVARPLLHMLTTGEFMPFALTMLAVAGRVRLLLLAQVHELRDLYRALLPYARVLPLPMPLHSAAPALSLPDDLLDGTPALESSLPRGPDRAEAGAGARAGQARDDIGAATEDRDLRHLGADDDTDLGECVSLAEAVPAAFASAEEKPKKSKKRKRKDESDRLPGGDSKGIKRRLAEEPGDGRRQGSSPASASVFWLQREPRAAPGPETKPNAVADAKKKSKKRDDLDDLFDMLDA